MHANMTKCLKPFHPEPSKRHWEIPTFAVVGCICASITMFLITPLGPGVIGDSTIYIESARNFLSGDGFSIGRQPMTHYPPGYPFLIALFGFFLNGDVIFASRLVGVFLFGINLLLFLIAVYSSTGRSLSAAFCAMAIYVFSRPIIYVHAMAWSDSLFLAFTLSTFILISQYLKSFSQTILFSAAILGGFAIATRYIGITLLPPVVLTLLFFGSRTRIQKFKDIGFFSVIVLLPLASWMVRNLILAHTTTNRTLAIHPLNALHLKSFVNSMHDFVLPLPIAFSAKLILLCLTFASIIGAFFILYRSKFLSSHENYSTGSICTLLLLFFLTYVAFLVISISFIDAHTPLNFRIMLPAYIAATIMIIALARSLSQIMKKPLIWLCFLIVAGLSIIINADLTITYTKKMYKDGLGYTSRHVKESPIISYLQDLREDPKIYTNGPDVIRFLTQKSVEMIPTKVFAGNRKPNPDYQEQLALMSEECKAGNAIIVYFKWVSWRWYLPPIEELAMIKGLSILQRYADGAIFGIAPLTRITSDTDSED